MKMKQGPSNIDKPKVPALEIDLSEAWDTESEADLLINKLKESGIYKPGLRFSGFNVADVGRKPEVVFCCTERDLRSGEGSGTQNALKYAEKHPRSVIAVYDAAKLTEAQEHGVYGYKLSDPSALLALVYLKS